MRGGHVLSHIYCTELYLTPFGQLSPFRGAPTVRGQSVVSPVHRSLLAQKGHWGQTSPSE